MNSTALADPVLAARRRMIEAKRKFTRAAMAALAGEPDATEKVSAALREIDAAREGLRQAELDARATQTA